MSEEPQIQPKKKPELLFNINKVTKELVGLNVTNMNISFNPKVVINRQIINSITDIEEIIKQQPKKQIDEDIYNKIEITNLEELTK